MVKTGSAILIFFIVLKDKQISQGAISSHAWLAIFIYILRFWEDITEKNVSNNNFQQIQITGSVSGSINTIFLQPCMAGEFSSITKDVACREKQILLDHQHFLQIFRQFFEKQHAIRSFENSFGCTKGCTFESYDYSKRILRQFLKLKVKMNLQR